MSLIRSIRPNRVYSGSRAPIPRQSASRYSLDQLGARRLNSTQNAPPRPPPPPPSRQPIPTGQTSAIRMELRDAKTGLFRPVSIVLAMFLLGGLAGAAYQLKLMWMIPKRSTQCGSPAELIQLQTMKRKMSEIEIVKELSQSSEWMELEDGPFGTTADDGDGSGGIIKSRENYPHSLVASSIVGSRRLGSHRAFYNPQNRELIVVTWLGLDLSGWPGIVHGGAAGTLLTTICEWNAALAEQTNELEHRKAAAPPSTSLKPLDSLTISYKAPTMADQFYILRSAPIPPPNAAEPDAPPPPPLEAPPKSKNHYVHDPTATLEIGASLETIEGARCVLATGVWRDNGPGSESAWRGWVRWWSKKR